MIGWRSSLARQCRGTGRGGRRGASGGPKGLHYARGPAGQNSVWPSTRGPTAARGRDSYRTLKISWLTLRTSSSPGDGTGQGEQDQSRAAVGMTPAPVLSRLGGTRGWKRTRSGVVVCDLGRRWCLSASASDLARIASSPRQSLAVAPDETIWYAFTSGIQVCGLSIPLR